MFLLRVLGSVALEGDRGPLAGRPVQPRRIALLALLASAPQHTMEREKLIALLWPDSDAEQGRHRLSESLYVLRRSLGDGALLSEGDRIRLDPAVVACDAVSFREALRAGELEAAVALYAGPYLDGFFLRDSVEFDPWVEGERRRLAEDYGRALETLAARASAQGDALGAVEHWGRLAGHDPYNSRYARGLMEALAAAGDRGNALNHFREHARVLRDELGAEPDPLLLAWCDAIRHGEAKPTGTAASAASRDPPADLRAASPPAPPVRAGAPPPRIAGAATGLGPVPSDATGPGGARRRTAWALGILAGLVVSGAAYRSLTQGPEAGLLPDLVVVPPFENRTGDPQLDELGLDAAVWVEEAVHQVEGVRLVPSAFARDYAAEVASAGSASPVRAVAERTRAGWVVAGVILERGDSLEFRADLIALSRPGKRQGVAEAGPREQANETLDRLARRLSGALAYEFDPWMGETEKGSQPLRSPPTIEAFREHRQGYEAYNRQDRAASFRHHMAAYTLDSTLVRALVAAAYMAGDFAKRDSLAREAAQRRHLLTRAGQLDLDVLLAHTAHDLAGGLRAMREAAALEGGGINSVLLGWFAMRLNLPGEALESTERYDPDLEWRRSEAWYYWRYRAEALHMLGRYDEELADVRRGRARYPDHGDLLHAEARALAALGRPDEALDRLHRYRARPQSHDSVSLLIGAELRAHGSPEAARAAFELAAEAAPGSLGEGAGPAEGLFRARALYGAERWAEAYEVARALLDATPDDLSALGMVGLTAARLGNVAEASAAQSRLSALARPDSPGEHLYLTAAISAVLGRPDEAMRSLYRAYGEGFPHTLRLHRDMDFECVRERADFRALVTPKG